jgi:putative endonuclease
MKSQAWHLYVVRCSDGTFYTGITTNLRRRTEQHNRGVGARYTRGRGPVVVVYQRRLANHGSALRAERAFKRLSRIKKLEHIDRYQATRLRSRRRAGRVKN